MGKGKGCCGFDGRRRRRPSCVPGGAGRRCRSADQYGRSRRGRSAAAARRPEAEAAAARIGIPRARTCEVLPDGANLGWVRRPDPRARPPAGGDRPRPRVGGGMDAFLAAREVGPEGKVIGVDMTPAMVEKARANAARAGFGNVEFREGRLEALPVDDASVDAVTSNCVINLVPDKAAVFREAARVLRPGGRLVVSDIILDGALPRRPRSGPPRVRRLHRRSDEEEPYFAAVEARASARSGSSATSTSSRPPPSRSPRGSARRWRERGSSPATSRASCGR